MEFFAILALIVIFCAIWYIAQNSNYPSADQHDYEEEDDDEYDEWGLRRPEEYLRRRRAEKEAIERKRRNEFGDHLGS